MPVYSISRIATFEKCPLKYRFRYIERIKPEIPTTIEAFMGSRVHDALEKLYREKSRGRVMTQDRLLGYYHRVWDKKWEDAILIVKPGLTADDYRKKGEEQLEDYYARHFPFDEGIIRGLETWARLALDADGKYGFNIRIDRLMEREDGLFEVHDYKCGSHLDTQDKLDQDRQLAIYSLWVRERFAGCRDVRLVWHYTAHGREMESWRTGEQLAALKSEILERIKTIEAAAEFPARVSRLCDWCEYRTICPEWNSRDGPESSPKPGSDSSPESSPEPS